MHKVSQNNEFGAMIMGVITAIVILFSLFITYRWNRALVMGQAHTCKWDKCPYKYVAFSARDSAVTHYLGDSLRMSDGWCLDMLHIEHPDMEYEQLDSLLFTSK